MPWPEPLGLLLARSDSRASQALRWGLCGLRASLQAVLDEIPDDPCCAELRALLAELDALVAPPSSFPGPSLPVDVPSGPAPAGTTPSAPLPTDSGARVRLLPLVQAVNADGRFRDILHRSALGEADDNAIWNDVQRLLLRARPDLAAEWQQRCLTLAGQAGARPDAAQTAVLPLGRDEVIYPGLTGAIQATGLRSASSAPLDSRVPAPAEADLRCLAEVTSTCLWFIENDPHLHHCLQSVFRFGVPSLTGDQRQRFLAELRRLWERVRAGDAGGPASGAGHRLKERLKVRLDLDEALHSLVYQPPADPESWWGRLQRRARDTLFQARDRAAGAGCSVHLQLLGGSFADINRLAPDSLQVDYGVPGEVAVCLRVWARIDGEELKGRVLYRSPREES
jgi:hypothetical protein